MPKWPCMMIIFLITDDAKPARPSFSVSQHTDRLEACDGDGQQKIADWISRARARFGQEANVSAAARGMPFVYLWVVLRKQQNHPDVALLV